MSSRISRFAARIYGPLHQTDAASFVSETAAGDLSISRFAGPARGTRSNSTKTDACLLRKYYVSDTRSRSAVGEASRANEVAAEAFHVLCEARSTCTLLNEHPVISCAGAMIVWVLQSPMMQAYADVCITYFKNNACIILRTYLKNNACTILRPAPTAIRRHWGGGPLQVSQPIKSMTGKLRIKYN